MCEAMKAPTWFEQGVEDGQADALADLAGTIDLDVDQAATVCRRIVAREQRVESGRAHARARTGR